MTEPAGEPPNSAGHPKLRAIVDECSHGLECIPNARYGEPMSAHCTFAVGGPADCFLSPSGEGFPDFAASLAARCRSEGIPLFVLGGGANIVPADSGIRGFVLCTEGWAGTTASGNSGLRFLSGTVMDEAAEAALESGLSGLEFLAGMPGSVGGAVRMNARCYGSEISDVLSTTEIVDLSGEVPTPTSVPANPADFGYKKSPFMDGKSLILSASFALKPGNPAQIRETMEKHRRDRREKGHYRLPSAGSAFKNNPAFGSPTGKIIDGLGLRGLRIGGAAVAQWHGNIIVNDGGATAGDIKALVDKISVRVMEATGFALEPEILFVG
jgi:UDP-N-acetylmuramate dehydrogenase